MKALILALLSLALLLGGCVMVLPHPSDEHGAWSSNGQCHTPGQILYPHTLAQMNPFSSNNYVAANYHVDCPKP